MKTTSLVLIETIPGQLTPSVHTFTNDGGSDAEVRAAFVQIASEQQHDADLVPLFTPEQIAAGWNRGHLDTSDGWRLIVTESR